MIEINLLPEERKKKRSHPQGVNLTRLSLAGVSSKILVYYGVGVLVLLEIALFGSGVYSKAAYNSIESQYRKIAPEKKEADNLRLQADKIKKKVAAIDELMVNRFEWAKKLNSLSDSVTAPIWLTDLSYSEKTVERARPRSTVSQKDKQPKAAASESVFARYMTISGYCLNSYGEGTAAIGKFIKSLKDNGDFYSDFSDIQLDSIKREKLLEEEVMSFKIVCLFNERSRWVNDEP